NLVQAAVPIHGDVEARLEPWQGGEPGVFSDRVPRLLIGDEIEVASAVGHIAECKRHAPKTFGHAFGPAHCSILVRLAYGRTCSGSGNARWARSNPSCAARRRAASRT